jgi:hypothetical protein
VDRLIDEHMPVFDVSEYHEVRVDASPDQAYKAVRRLDAARSRSSLLLLVARGLLGLVTPRQAARSLGGFPWRPRFTLEDMVRAGFVVLAERPGREILLGAVGAFWKPGGGLRRIEAQEFGPFDEPHHAKATWNFEVRADGDGSFVSTETRVLCTDPAARRSFRRYWRAVGPFSAFTRGRLLALIKRDAESGVVSVGSTAATGTIDPEG